MRVIIENEAQGVAERASTYIVKKIHEHSQRSSKPFILGLPTGSTPLKTYAELIKLHKAGKISFKNVITFNMDEYVNLPKEHPESYHSFMWNNFFKHIDIQESNVNILNGNAADLAKECQNYEDKIVAVGGIDLFLGGIGNDGHIAFNEPYSSLQSRTRIKTLTYDTLVANSRFFNNDVNAVPKSALTVGVGTIMDSREVVILATGHAKALAVKQGIEGSYNHKWTISALQTHRHGILICDDEAAGELSVNTYRYFVGLEKQMKKNAQA
ncbi:MAG: glucosamine-6-phosphate deaminase [Bacteroidales bacterium]